jgi:hypothetical protein
MVRISHEEDGVQDSIFALLKATGIQFDDKVRPKLQEGAELRETSGKERRVGRVRN